MRLPILRALALGATITSACFCANLATAQHSDVEFIYESGKIAIEFGDEGQVFEGDFAEGLDPNRADEPGFASELSEGLGINPNDIIGYNVLGPLLYHTGAGFAPTSATLAVQNFPSGPDVMVDSSTLSGSGFIGQAEPDGDFHTDIDFSINAGAPTGAYGLLLSLSSFDATAAPQALIDDSDPFYIVFNRGLEEMVFEDAVGAFAARVPEPSSLLLAGLSLAAVTAARRRRQPPSRQA